MIINKLAIHNVGTFAGRHVIDLTPPSGNKPIVLIGGLNGAGKTTILESIQLALYGSLAYLSRKQDGSYENYLRGLIHRDVPASEGAAIELTFTVHQEGDERTFWIRRSWKSTGKSIREILLVSVDGTHNPSLTSTWNEHVETFLPRGIAGLFFFDGEQIEALADMDRSRQVLGSAIDALLGLDLVERLNTDLVVLKRRHRGDHVPEDLRVLVEDKKQLVTSRRQAEEVAIEGEAARRTEVERRQKLLFEATEAYRAAGGDLLEQRESAENAAAMVKAAIVECESEIRHELAELAPLLQVGDLLGQLAQRVSLEHAANRDAVLVEVLNERDEALLEQLRTANVTDEAVSTISKFLDADRSRRGSSADTAEIIGINDPATLEVRLMMLPDVRRRLKTIVDRRVELEEKLGQAERVLAAIPDPEALAPLREQREEAQDAMVRAEASFAMATELLQSARNDRDKAQAEYESTLDKAANANLTAEDDRRIVEHIDRVTSTLERLRVSATRRHVKRISELVLEALDSLLRKRDLVTDVQIDPDTQTVSLTGADGSPLSATDLSAGERQLLAVALLWGLARAAGQPLPVVVDTPLGRLDRSHREHLLERYFPHASHQVVLLSTDTEVDREAFARLVPHLGRVYHLKFDSATNATYVEEGYFWGAA